MKFVYPGPAFNVSCHNHSSWSDGGSPLEEVCRKGKEMGLKVLGMSDHYVLPPGEGYDSETWSMKLSRLEEYIEVLQKMKKELEDDTFSLKIGLEVDFFFENIDELLAKLSFYPLDYLIGSVHYSGKFPIDHSSEDWVGLSEKDKEDICTEYYDKLAAAALRREFLFIGHLDLPKKFGLIDNEKYFPHALKILDNLAVSGIGMELNTAGWYKECNEQYPSLAILKEANKRKIPVIVNADAHDASHLKRSFEQASKVLKEAGYPDRPF